MSTVVIPCALLKILLRLLLDRVTSVSQSNVVELKVKTQVQVPGFATCGPVFLNKSVTFSTLY